MFYSSKQLAKALLETAKEKTPENAVKDFIVFLKFKKITYQLPKILQHLEITKKIFLIKLLDGFK